MPGVAQQGLPDRLAVEPLEDDPLGAQFIIISLRNNMFELADRLVAEVNIQPSDIDVVFPGLKSEIRLPAFKQRLVPYLHGEVTWVAADVTTNEQTRQQYYRAYILIDREQMEALPNVFLTPGMPVEAHVQIGERSFFQYMTQPIRDSFARAFREQ